MTWYTLALFLHIVGALTLFIAIGVQLVSIARMRQAHTVEQVREWSSVIPLLGRLFGIGELLILGAGIYLVIAVWGWTRPWIDVSLAGLILLAALGGASTSRRLQAIQRASLAAPAGPASASLTNQIHDQVLWISVLVSAGAALGIIALMTIKPEDWIEALVIIVVASIVGLAGALALPRTAQQGQAKVQS